LESGVNPFRLIITNDNKRARDCYLKPLHFIKKTRLVNKDFLTLNNIHTLEGNNVNFITAYYE